MTALASLARLQIVPLTIFALCLAIGVRVFLLADTTGAISPALAAAPEEQDGVRAEDADEKGDAADGGTGAPQERQNLKPPRMRSQVERELIEDLRSRRDALDAREAELEERATLLAATETRLKEQLAELEALRGEIEGLLKQHSAEQDEQMAQLVKIYETMKPKDAARIFDQMDHKTLLDVLERMKTRSSAPILAQMSPETARAVTLSLATRRQLP